jgi:hypothetical protein
MTERNHGSYDADLTPEERELVGRLTAEEIEIIDQGLLANVSNQWRKVAMVVGLTIMELKANMKNLNGIPDVYYAERVISMVRKGLLELEGDVKRMRFSEVRLTGK